MGLTRTIRKPICWLLASAIILPRSLDEAKSRSFQDGIITPVSFHNPNRKLFADTVIWFKENGYTFISSDQLINILHNEIPCPRGAVWLSLDDGWKGNISNVIPVVVKYDVPITIFIYTDGVEEGVFWWTKFSLLSNRFPPMLRKTKELIKLPEDKRRQVIELLNFAVSSSRLRREAMTIEDVRRISQIPQITIGSHTVTHPVLPNCTESQIEYELKESKKKLEDWTGKSITTFAYPGGHFTGQEKRFLRSYGYEVAATTVKKLASSTDDPYLIPRTDGIDDGSLAENLCHFLGIWEPTVSRIKRIIKPKFGTYNSPLTAEATAASKSNGARSM